MRRDEEEKENGGKSVICSDEQLILGGYELHIGSILHGDWGLKRP